MLLFSLDFFHRPNYNTSHGNDTLRHNLPDLGYLVFGSGYFMVAYSRGIVLVVGFVKKARKRDRASSWLLAGALLFGIGMGTSFL